MNPQKNKASPKRPQFFLPGLLKVALLPGHWCAWNRRCVDPPFSVSGNPGKLTMHACGCEQPVAQGLHFFRSEWLDVSEDGHLVAMHVGMQIRLAKQCWRQLPGVPGARAHPSDTAECLGLTLLGPQGGSVCDFQTMAESGQPTSAEIVCPIIAPSWNVRRLQQHIVSVSPEGC